MGQYTFSKRDGFLDGSNYIGQTVSRGSITLEPAKSRFHSNTYCDIYCDLGHSN